MKEPDNKTAGAYKGYVHVWATAPEIAPAANFLVALGFFSPAGVK
jgi:hypothetical protein